MREAEQRLTEEQETMLGLQVAPSLFAILTFLAATIFNPFFGFCNFGGSYWVENEESGWLGLQVLSPHCNRPMCRNYRPLQAEAEAMMPVEDISDDSAMVDIARIDIKVVRAAEGMEARFGSDDMCVTAVCETDKIFLCETAVCRTDKPANRSV